MALIDWSFDKLFFRSLGKSELLEFDADPVDKLPIAFRRVVREDLLPDTLPETSHCLLSIDLNQAVSCLQLLTAIDFNQRIKHPI
jgi:hypothetical protein